MPQEGFLFAGTVRDNIAFGSPDASPAEVAAAAQAVGAHEFIMALEDGYETNLQERGTRLSLGQRQLVAFARALLADPRILILDEATSSVDIGTERRIESALRTLLADRTAFVIAHRLSTIRDADLIVVLEHGQVIEQGTHGELMARRASTRRCTATGRKSRNAGRPLEFALVAGSSNGRTPGSGPGSLGSNPSPAALRNPRPHAGFSLSPMPVRAALFSYFELDDLPRLMDAISGSGMPAETRVHVGSYGVNREASATVHTYGPRPVLADVQGRGPHRGLGAAAR